MVTKLKLNYFNKNELALWIGSMITIIISFCIFDRHNYLTLVASIIGVTSLIFSAKGNLIGQFLMIIFSLIYGIISYKCSYYGEMITYLGMTMPMAVIALISWLKNPFNGNRSQVKVNRISKKEVYIMVYLTIIVTIMFYIILRYFNTANLLLSTLSVTTSFVAVYLTYKRSPYFALAYAANDIVLIILWSLLINVDVQYISVVVCFIAFLINDIYGYINWRKIEIKQSVYCN